MHNEHTSHRANTPHHARTSFATAVAAALLAHTLPIVCGSGSSERAHALPRHPPAALAPPNRSPYARRTHDRGARWRHLTLAPRCPSVLRDHCREAWPNSTSSNAPRAPSRESPAPSLPLPSPLARSLPLPRALAALRAAPLDVPMSAIARNCMCIQTPSR